MIVFISSLMASSTYGREVQYDSLKVKRVLKNTTAGCAPAAGFEWLDVNNVKARINTGGDMWWDLPGGTGSKYYIPKNGTATSMFSGALWIGGLDINNQLKLAALRYRQVGVDYWTGPLTTDGTAAIDAATCSQYDKHFKIYRADVDEFLSHTDPVTGTFIPDEDYNIPESILNWPAHGDPSKGQSYYLAPFYDNDGDGEYDPLQGDYPYYDIDNSLCHTKTPTKDEEIEGTIHGSVLSDQVIKGDQTLWWVFNDKGNAHTETQGSAIGMEIRAQAFAFATNDVINNMTFYSYEIINRSTFELTNTYFSPWVDTDLGYAYDDFVGCDVERGLGYCYNGKDIDGNGDVESYGDQPPAVGVDFFQGPYMDPDGIDNPKYDITVDTATGDTIKVQLCDESINGVNFGNGIVDDERFGMRRFVYHNNGGNPAQSDPDIAPQYYNLLRGIWKDGTKMYFGGTGYITGQGTVGPVCDFMFPGDSDPCNWGTGGQPPNGGFGQNGFYWTEQTGNNGSPNPPGDRRFMQSAGPFTLKPGAVNYITVGIPWARATSGGAWASVELLRVVDDKCQALFDNCFKVIDGPSAPDLSVLELDRKFIFYISNSQSSNNYQEKYSEFDPNIIQPYPLDPTKRSDSLYRFEGYQIFQLKNDQVTTESIHDPNLMRLVAEFDIKNGVTKLVNFNYDEAIGANVPIIEVKGGDNGIRHSFEVTQDAFATGDVRLVNNKVYYYTAISYAYNNYMDYSEDPNVHKGLYGQKIPYLSGRKNIKLYSAMPHRTVNGTVINGDYGIRPEIKRIAGYGNGGMTLELSDETVNQILSKPPASETNLFGGPDYPMVYNPIYKVNAGPVNVKVINPLGVKEGDYELWLDSLERVKIYDVVDMPGLLGDTTSKLVARWHIKDIATGELYTADTTIFANNEQMFNDLGISVQMTQPYQPGPIGVGKISVENALRDVKVVLAENNGLINSSVIYDDSSRMWLSGVEDEDVPGYVLDWIRSGTYQSQENASDNDWQTNLKPPTPWDPNEAYEKIAKGTWAPYALAAYSLNDPLTVVVQSQVGPALTASSKILSGMDDLASVDIVFTPDKTKWSRCPVIEMSADSLLAEGHAKQFSLRAAPSVDKDGNFATPGSGSSDNPNDPNYISDHGMGWFPGYAINVETGERLNLMFSEDSYLGAFNGRDMLLNPTEKDPDITIQYFDDNIFSGTGINRIPVLGGKHFVYVFKHNKDVFNFSGIHKVFNSPAYDAGKYAHTLIDTLTNDPLRFVMLPHLYGQVMYVGMPMATKGKEWLSNAATVKIRVATPYRRGYSSAALDTVYPGMDVNNQYPIYEFSTKGVSTEYSNPEKLTSDLDEIRVVPNPYYAYSAYEHNALDTRVKITNLPRKCTITIYNVSGVKVRQLTKDDPVTALEWDLKNFAGVPISGGIYYIHVEAPEGEHVVKWFCSQRVPDLNTF
ncbi:MAG: T9SS C-terminal target domain-containing protein [Bacteroidetes bacterium]|nr:MAG: T9SS C-terminal target domain-containing protein [Bacteroidota bacterium]